jgi:sugar/nucleoside kinase (ribokinase family)
MTVLVVGSVALDSVETPFGRADNVLGGSGTFFSAAASHLAPVQLVGVIGADFPLDKLKRAFASRPIDISGLEQADGTSFRWRGRYRHDLNVAETLETHLGVFSNFRPKIPEQFRSAPFVFLGNIDPRLQLDVLTQVAKPKLVACDTMNFWIEGKSDSLKRLLASVDGLVINDSEARLLAGELNSVAAARRLIDLGLKFLVIKRGEFGAALFHGGHYFAVPAYPIERPVDPTGAGDSFAGGFMGHLARAESTSGASLRQAMIYGTVMASFCVEDFSLKRLAALNDRSIEARAKEMRAFLDIDGPKRRA